MFKSLRNISLGFFSDPNNNTLKGIVFFCIILILFSSCSKPEKSEPRQSINLEKGWKFINTDIEYGYAFNLSTEDWQDVKIPHDWAISGEFDENHDIQQAKILEGGVRMEGVIRGRTGGLPHVGVGWYRNEFVVPSELKDKRLNIEFDGAMSNSKIYFNEVFIGEWPYGYTSFTFDLTEHILVGKTNVLAVRLENKPRSSRWYPGAGIYRNVRLVYTEPVYIPRWGTYITTPFIEQDSGTVNQKTTIKNYSGSKKTIALITELFSPVGELINSSELSVEIENEAIVEQNFTVASPVLWSLETPVLYKSITYIFEGDKKLDTYVTDFGFRFFEFKNDRGFFLNGKHLPIKGVCLHHDLGPLGAAINKSALRYRLELLKEMGCNAIRTSHNPPSPQLLELSDEMGFLVVVEIFDEWKTGKIENGYHTLWDDWAEKDLVALILRDRNHPSVIMWSIGNEIPDQSNPDGLEYCNFLMDICKREDPTRPVTAGLNRYEASIKNGFAEALDVVGWNYKAQFYQKTHTQYPHWKMYASEATSTVSSRGEYFFPAVEKIGSKRYPYHGNAFDMESPWEGRTPDREFAAQDSFPFIAGQFVWTGFDYLGEPTPYNSEWPARSSYFGIIDLCGLPKDRYYLYQSQWAPEKETLHLLPHWNWEEGEIVSVHSYTSYDKAELFLNGESLGIRTKDKSQVFTAYRLVWDSIIYKPGELKIVALDNREQPVKEAYMKTAENPAKIVLTADRSEIISNGMDLVFIKVDVVDINGNLCPRANNLIKFEVSGAGNFKAVGNGDPTSLESFVMPFRKAFNGRCMLIVESLESDGWITVTAESEGLKSTEIRINSRPKK